MQQGNEENVIVRTNVIKRNGQEVTFDITKIINAIGKANHEVAGIHQMNGIGPAVGEVDVVRGQQ